MSAGCRAPLSGRCITALLANHTSGLVTAQIARVGGCYAVKVTDFGRPTNR